MDKIIKPLIFLFMTHGNKDKNVISFSFKNLLLTDTIEDKIINNI